MCVMHVGHVFSVCSASISERCECDTAVEADLAGSVHSDGSQGLTEGGSGAQSNGDLTGVGREGTLCSVALILVVVVVVVDMMCMLACLL